jgi:hypothetical protein
MDSHDDLGKLRAEMLALMASTDKQINNLNARMDDEANKRDLGDLEQRLL